MSEVQNIIAKRPPTRHPSAIAQDAAKNLSQELIHAFAVILAAATLVLIIAGGLVTSTDSGLSVPDWPLSYGMLFPPMIGGIRFEHTHRVIAGVVMILPFLLAALVFRQSNNRIRRVLVTLAVAAVLAQALIGGLTVLFLLPTLISVAHACLGQTFFALVVVLAWMTSSPWQKGERFFSIHTPGFRKVCLGLAGMIFIQLIFGSLLKKVKALSCTQKIRSNTPMAPKI